MYAHLIACTGWTWEYIDDYMTVPRLLAMNEYWESNPPLHQMVAAYFGIKPASSQSSSETQGDDFASLLGDIALTPHQGPKPQL